MLYPKLCFVDAVSAVVPEESKEELEHVLSEEDYEICTSGSGFRIRSYFLEKFREKYEKNGG